MSVLKGATGVWIGPLCCRRKVGHHSLSKVQTLISKSRSVKESRSEFLSVYVCHHCGWFHIGHDTRPTVLPINNGRQDVINRLRSGQLIQPEIREQLFGNVDPKQPFLSEEDIDWVVMFIARMFSMYD